VTFGGQEISEAAFAAALERAWSARQDAVRIGGPGCHATRFDLETLAFTEARVDWGVLACGLGGLHATRLHTRGHRLDAFAIARQQQSRTIRSERCGAIGMARYRRDRLNIGGKP
jgi:hypothetical protein